MTTALRFDRAPRCRAAAAPDRCRRRSSRRCTGTGRCRARLAWAGAARRAGRAAGCGALSTSAGGAWRGWACGDRAPDLQACRPRARCPTRSTRSDRSAPLASPRSRSAALTGGERRASDLHSEPGCTAGSSWEGQGPRITAGRRPRGPTPSAQRGAAATIASTAQPTSSRSNPHRSGACIARATSSASRRLSGSRPTASGSADDLETTTWSARGGGPTAEPSWRVGTALAVLRRAGLPRPRRVRRARARSTTGTAAPRPPLPPGRLRRPTHR